MRTKLLTIYTTMKKLFLLLALVGMVATACEDDGVNEPTTPEDKTQPIKFIDNTVKALCVDSWDTNGDAELSYEEAAAVTDIGITFRSSDIISFTELAYFTGLSYIANEAFLDCGSLKKIELPHNITSIGEAAIKECPLSNRSNAIGNSYTCQFVAPIECNFSNLSNAIGNSIFY